MQIPDRHVHPLAQPRPLDLQQLAEPLLLPLVLAEDRDVVRLGQLRQLADRLLRLGLEPLQRLDRQLDVRDLLAADEAGHRGGALVELAQLQPRELLGLPQHADSG